MVKVIIPRKYGPYKIYNGVLQIDRTNRLLLFRSNKPYLKSFLFYSCLDDRIEILDWLLNYNPEIDNSLTNLLLYFLKTKGSIVVNLEKTQCTCGDYRWVSELLGNIIEEEVVEITDKTNVIWKLKDCTT